MFFNDRRILTAGDLAEFPTTLSSGLVRYELLDGCLLILPPLTLDESRSFRDLLYQLTIQGEHRGFGTVWGRVGIIRSRNPDDVAAPEGCFIVTERLPPKTSVEDYLETMPDIVVEVVHHYDTLATMDEKVQRYLRAGVRVIWVPDPPNRVITEYRPNQQPVVLNPNDTLTIPDIIPGFSVRVADLLPS